MSLSARRVERGGTMHETHKAIVDEMIFKTACRIAAEISLENAINAIVEYNATHDVPIHEGGLKFITLGCLK